MVELFGMVEAVWLMEVPSLKLGEGVESREGEKEWVRREIIKLYVAVNMKSRHDHCNGHDQNQLADVETPMYRRIHTIRPWAMHLRIPPNKGDGLILRSLRI